MLRFFSGRLVGLTFCFSFVTFFTISDWFILTKQHDFWCFGERKWWNYFSWVNRWMQLSRFIIQFSYRVIFSNKTIQTRISYLRIIQKCMRELMVNYSTKSSFIIVWQDPKYLSTSYTKRMKSSFWKPRKKLAYVSV